MKKSKVLIFLLALFLIAQVVKAQDNAKPKPYVIHTMYLNRTAETFRINLDSLLKVYKQDIMDPNPFLSNSKIVAHWWGHDSREILQISELKNLDELEPAFEKQSDIIKEYAKTHKEFVRIWMSLFVQPEHHSDEIYRVVAE